jgi:hypothetical protein
MNMIYWPGFHSVLNGSILNKPFTKWKGFFFSELIIFAAHYERKKDHFYRAADYCC